MKSKVFRISIVFIKIIIFLLITLLLLNITSTIFLPKWTLNKDSFQTNAVKGYYKEEKNSLDVIYVGSSDVYRGVSPMVIWNQHGIVGYDYATTAARMWTNYYMIQDALHSQKPKYIFLEMESAFSNSSPRETNARKSYDNMKPSLDKLEAVTDPIQGNDFFSVLSYIFPILRYHDRFSSLEPKDFTVFFDDYTNPQKGFAVTTSVKAPETKKDYMKPTKISKKVEQPILKYFEKILKICKENNTTLVLFSVPSMANWNYDMHNGVVTLASTYGVDYLDMNLFIDDMGLDWNKDTCDGGTHLNLAGANKVSTFFGNYISSKYKDIPDRRTDTSYNIWNTHYKQYLKTVEDITIQQKQEELDAKNKSYNTEKPKHNKQ